MNRSCEERPAGVSISPQTESYTKKLRKVASGHAKAADCCLGTILSGTFQPKERSASKDAEWEWTLRG
jgi:hypothetical protein